MARYLIKENRIIVMDRYIDIQLGEISSNGQEYFFNAHNNDVDFDASDLKYISDLLEELNK